MNNHNWLTPFSSFFAFTWKTFKNCAFNLRFYDFVISLEVVLGISIWVFGVWCRCKRIYVEDPIAEKRRFQVILVKLVISPKTKYLYTSLESYQNFQIVKIIKLLLIRKTQNANSITRISLPKNIKVYI